MPPITLQDSRFRQPKYTLFSTRVIEMTPPDITHDLILRQGMHPRHCTVRITLSPFDLVILVLRAN